MKKYSRKKAGIFEEAQGCWIPFDPRNSDYQIYIKNSLPTLVPERAIEFFLNEIGDVLKLHYGNKGTLNELGSKFTSLGEFLAETQWEE